MYNFLNNLILRHNVKDKTTSVTKPVDKNFKVENKLHQMLRGDKHICKNHFDYAKHDNFGNLVCWYCGNK